MVNRLANLIRNNRIAATSMLFLSIYCLIVAVKPTFLFTRKGNLRTFGLRSGDSTVLPLWLISIAVGVCACLLVELYLLSLG